MKYNERSGDNKMDLEIDDEEEEEEEDEDILMNVIQRISDDFDDDGHVNTER